MILKIFIYFFDIQFYGFKINKGLSNPLNGLSTFLVSDLVSSGPGTSLNDSGISF